MRLWHFLIGSAWSCLTSKNVLDAAERVFCNFNGSVDYSDFGVGTFDSAYWKCEPDSPKVISPKFYYFTKDLANESLQYEIINYWQNGSEDFLAKTVFPDVLMVFTHGFLDNMSHRWTTRWTLPAKDALFGLANPPAVLEFDWSAGAEDFWNYGRAATNTQVAGRILGKFLFDIKTKHPDQYLYLVGHSLGAHVCGQAGFWLKELSNNTFKVDRIDGLDPAGPFFIDDKALEDYGPNNKGDQQTKLKQQQEQLAEKKVNGSFTGFDFKAWWKQFQDGIFEEKTFQVDTFRDEAAPLNSRLDPTDAHFVSVIHTNAFGFGVFENIGHLDFWPDGGAVQTGCMAFDGPIENMSKCSHRMAHDLWQRSIKQKIKVKNLCRRNVSTSEISALSCPNSTQKTFLGYHAKPTTTPKFYYLNTTTAVPGLEPSNEAEIAVRSTSLFIPLLILISTVVSVIHCVKHRQTRDTDEQLTQTTYTEAQFSPVNNSLVTPNDPL